MLPNASPATGAATVTFDLDLLTVKNGGSVSTAFNTLILGIEVGQSYLNIHTTAFPGGEIRGFLRPVPEPSIYDMMFAGLGMLGFAGRRRIRHS
ncbi:MAG TPA: PEP-CTERM sorting domain-containing protein [Rhodocyclaceae bacterium]|nr:PEP-CTERM sorting domain-containing protein [Rhodocyclaceae bacterium]